MKFLKQKTYTFYYKNSIFQTKMFLKSSIFFKILSNFFEKLCTIWFPAIIVIELNFTIFYQYEKLKW